MDDIDAYRVAKVLMDNKGDAALAHAQSRITDLTMQGDDAGRVAWHQIVMAMQVLRAPGPSSGQQLQ